MYKDIAPEDIIRIEEEGKMECTKGEWKEHGEIIETDYAPNGAVIASINSATKQWEANAHLIAAAPDMLMALKAWDKLRAMRPLDSGADIDEILNECSLITDKALLKAGGG